MLTRRRYAIVVAALIAASSAYSNGADQKQDGPDSSPKETHGHENQAKSLPSKVALNPLPHEQERKPDNQDSLKATDIVQAVSAAFVAVFTFFLVIIGKKQWNATAAAAHAAQVAADAAKKSADVAVSSLRDVQRAFVSFETLNHQLLTVESASRKDRKRRFWATWQNGSSTPAKNLRLYINYVFTKDELDGYTPELESRGQRTIDPLGEPAILGPHSSVNSPVCLFDVTEVWATRDQGGHALAHIYIWGWAEYDDVFQDTERHRTEFFDEFEYLGQAITDRSPQYHFHRFGPHNGMDKECGRQPKRNK